jgi:HSP20 family protein
MAKIPSVILVRDIAGFDPFEDPFEDLFRGFFLRPMSLEPRGLGQQAQFKMDVTENDKEYRILADLPGVRKEDINVTVDGNEVAISAEVKNEKDVKDNEGTVLRSERHYGKIYRAFTLGQEVDQSGAHAKYNDGVLELTLPKSARESAKKKRISVH